MRLPRLRKTQPDLPGDVAATLELGRGERVLAHAVDDASGGTVVATTWALCVVTPDATAVSLRRPWHVVDAGVWQHETFLLTVTFVDGTRPVQWTLRDQQTLLPETLRERVQASVVLAQRLSVGERRMARVAIRKDFRTGELVSQTVLGRGVRASDVSVQEQVAQALAELEDQVGITH